MDLTILLKQLPRNGIELSVSDLIRSEPRTTTNLLHYISVPTLWHSGTTESWSAGSKLSSGQWTGFFDGSYFLIVLSCLPWLVPFVTDSRPICSRGLTALAPVLTAEFLPGLQMQRAMQVNLRLPVQTVRPIRAGQCLCRSHEVAA